MEDERLGLRSAKASVERDQFLECAALLDVRVEVVHEQRAGHVLRRRALRVIMALVVAALLCAGGLLFWNQLKSYEWWTDAQIGGLVRSLETQ